MAYKLTGKVQHYAWGGYEFIPRLLHQPNPDHQPFAEYWLGAHDKAPSVVSLTDETFIPLNEFIQSNPEKYLGKETNTAFGRLPYLLKVLDVRDMLSIQVHPTKEEARIGFSRENAAGVPLDAPQRNYKDDNHKPEMMVALSEFYLLHGFREDPSLREILSTVPEFNSLIPYYDKRGYASLYSHVMNMPQFRINEILQPLLNRLLPAYLQGKIAKHNPDFWAARALASGMTQMDSPDRGIFSIYFFNLVRMEPGEGIFQAAGLPHAYLEGQNMELMANSDNVLRGGLTPKHVAVEELLKHIRFEGISPAVLKPSATANGISDYAAPVDDFNLTKMIIEKGKFIDNQSKSLEISILLSGRLTVQSQTELTLESGEAFICLPGEKSRWRANARTLLYKASVPVQPGS